MKQEFRRMFATAIMATMLLATGLCVISCAQSTSPIKPEAEFSFAFSGDSRDCGDVIMPAIASQVNKSGAAFYWHLGDFRAMYAIDRDVKEQASYKKEPPSLLEYYANIAWNDFLNQQIKPITIPVYLTPGNHEFLYPDVDYPKDARPIDGITPKSRSDYRMTFSPYMPPGSKQTYFHWTKGSVDFIALDNATDDQFDDDQLKWFEEVMHRDESDSSIKTIVVGMHEALPQSIASNHSMDQAEPKARANGNRVYDLLLSAQYSGKFVYVLASHSHYFMDGIFNNRPAKERLRGFIVGTAGAVRYRLPPNAGIADKAKTDIYGYMIARIRANGEVEFRFHEIHESQVPKETSKHYDSKFVHWCFARNSKP